MLSHEFVCMQTPSWSASSPDDVQDYSIFAGHWRAVVGLHQQWPCFGALLKVPGAPLGAWQGLILGHQASLWQAAHALPPSKVLFCQLLHLHNTQKRAFW